MNKTSISWVRNPDPIAGMGFTWNPIVGCSPASKGCEHCYAARLAGTRLAHLHQYAGLVSKKREVETRIQSYRGRNKGATPQVRGSLKLIESIGHWTGEVRFFPEKLAEPLRRRTPSGIFCGDMGDIALLPFEQIAAIFGVMAACPQHRFYLLTKRPGRLRELFELVERNRVVKWGEHAGERLPDVGWLYGRVWQHWSQGIPGQQGKAYRLAEKMPWPLPNVWIGASVCTRSDLGNLDELRRITAAVRFVSFEPLLEDLGQVDLTGIAWAIIGGESGPRARPCNVEWIRSLVRQCKTAGVATFVKQLGAEPRDVATEEAMASWHVDRERLNKLWRPAKFDALWPQLRDRAGADMDEWPADLRVREIPKVKP